jgi:hypothetical protein
VIRLQGSVIKGFHEYKIHPPMTNPPTQLRVDLEYTNLHDPHASLVWIPEIESFPSSCHDMVTDEKRCLKLMDVAGLPIGHAPRGISAAFRQILEGGAKIFAEPTGEPCPSFSPWPSMLEKGGGIVIPCDYIMQLSQSSDYNHVISILQGALSLMAEREAMSIV